MKTNRLRQFWFDHWQLLLLTAALFALWQTPLVFPSKLTVVYLHELSHGFAAILTGGEVLEMSVSRRIGGFAVTRGGNAFVIFSAGYLGSLLLGAGLLIAALRSEVDRYVLGGLGALTLLVTAAFMREGFAILYGVVTGSVLLAVAVWCGHAINDLALRVIGLSSMIYVPFDIFDDTIRRANLRSDARMLAEEFGGTTLIWGGLWLVISLVVIVFTLRLALHQRSNLDFRKTVR
ncbi:MAG: M50 family metallopeptidase [Pseudomonadota bacterium]